MKTPKCVVCGEPTLFTICTWFSSGELVVNGVLLERTGVNVPGCVECKRAIAPNDDSIHFMVVA